MSAAKQKMTYGEECDLKAVVIENWVYVTEAYTRGLPTGFYTRDQVASIEAIRKADMLDGDLNWAGLGEGQSIKCPVDAQSMSFPMRTKS